MSDSLEYLAYAYRGKNGVTWYNPSSYNGVLILLREPHIDKNEIEPEKVILGNWKWLTSVIFAPTGRFEKRYHNRIIEMLGALPNIEHCPEQIAYANLNIRGGGATSSKNYWDILNNPEKRQQEMNRIFSCVSKEKTRYIITCKEIFEALSDFETIRENAGFQYTNNSITRSGKMDGIILIEMLKHPCISPAVVGAISMDKKIQSK